MLPILAARTYALQQHSPGKKPFAPLAQLAEQLTLNQRVAGSIPARCILRPVSVRRRCLVSPTWNASVPFLVAGPSADMNSVVSYFAENVSFQIIATELSAGVAVHKAHFTGDVIKVRPQIEQPIGRILA